MPNPLVLQGTLNKVRTSLTWPGNPTLNVTAPYLGKEGIRFSLEGESVLYMPTMTGAVTSQEPYMMLTCDVYLLKSQALANLYKQQLEQNALLGNCTIRGDAVPLGVFYGQNCSIKGVQPLEFSGENVNFVVRIGGYYNINANLFF